MRRPRLVPENPHRRIAQKEKGSPKTEFKWCRVCRRLRWFRDGECTECGTREE